jgi:sarcosine/dimethylglycine N-methyltransferase
MTMPNPDSERETAIYRRNYDTELSELLSAIWGGHLHMGVFDGAGEPLLDAQMRANSILAIAASLKPGDHVLEVACGVGGTARDLAQKFGTRVTATNIAERQIAEAREITAREGLSGSIDYRYADYHNLPFPDASFDTWWCQEALLYSVDKPRVFREALRVLKPHGRIVFSDLTYNQPSEPAREDFSAAIRAPGLWSGGQWEEMIASLPVNVLLARDWSEHVATTFSQVRAKLLAVRGDFTKRTSAELVDGTVDRVTRQLEAARDGKLGCIAFVLSPI